MPSGPRPDARQSQPARGAQVRHEPGFPLQPPASSFGGSRRLPTALPTSSSPAPRRPRRVPFGTGRPTAMTCPGVVTRDRPRWFRTPRALIVTTAVQIVPFDRGGRRARPTGGRGGSVTGSLASGPRGLLHRARRPRPRFCVGHAGSCASASRSLTHASVRQVDGISTTLPDASGGQVVRRPDTSMPRAVAHSRARSASSRFPARTSER